MHPQAHLECGGEPHRGSARRRRGRCGRNPSATWTAGDSISSGTGPAGLEALSVLRRGPLGERGESGSVGTAGVEQHSVRQRTKLSLRTLSIRRQAAHRLGRSVGDPAGIPGRDPGPPPSWCIRTGGPRTASRSRMCRRTAGPTRARDRRRGANTVPFAYRPVETSLPLGIVGREQPSQLPARMLIEALLG